MSCGEFGTQTFSSLWLFIVVILFVQVENAPESIEPWSLLEYLCFGHSASSFTSVNLDQFIDEAIITQFIVTFY